MVSARIIRTPTYGEENLSEKKERERADREREVRETLLFLKFPNSDGRGSLSV